MRERITSRPAPGADLMQQLQEGYNALYCHHAVTVAGGDEL
jgi:hypothetical protein